jgi:SAM-dependent methyltransferase
MSGMAADESTGHPPYLARQPVRTVLGIPDYREDSHGVWKSEAWLLPRLQDRALVDGTRELVDAILEGNPSRSAEDRAALRAYFLDSDSSRGEHRVRVVEHLTALVGRRVDYSSCLDIGCGAGVMLQAMAKRGQVYGLDVNLLHLLIAKTRIPASAELAAASAERIPWPDDRFTFVHAVHTLEHVSDQRVALREMWRVLAPGGLLAFDIPNRFSLWREPHTRRWGLGFLPRSWTALAVIRNQSLWVLRKLCADAFGSERFSILSMLERFQVPGGPRGRGYYLAAKALRTVEHSALGSVVRTFQPGFEVIAWKPALPF